MASTPRKSLDSMHSHSSAEHLQSIRAIYNLGVEVGQCHEAGSRFCNPCEILFITITSKMVTLRYSFHSTYASQLISKCFYLTMVTFFVVILCCLVEIQS